MAQGKKPNIDWNNPKSKVTEHFTVHDATFLPSWGVYHIPDTVQRTTIENMASRMEKVRAFLGKPIIVHVWIRPRSTFAPGTPYHTKNYNAEVKGATASAHLEGRGVDFHVQGQNCDETRRLLEPELERFGLRMEKNTGGNWVHLDDKPVSAGGKRYFNV